MLKLYGYWRSSASWRIRWALELKELAYEYEPVNLLTGAHKSLEHEKRAAHSMVPILEYAPKSYLSQSLAILFYLERNFPEKATLFPSATEDFTHCLELCECINADTAPLQIPSVQNFHSEKAEDKKKWAQHFIKRGLNAYSKLLKKPDAQFSLGSEISAADLFLIPQLYNANRYEIDLKKEYPLLEKIYQNCFQTAACQNSSPEKQVDAL